MLFKRIFK